MTTTSRFRSLLSMKYLASSANASGMSGWPGSSALLKPGHDTPERKTVIQWKEGTRYPRTVAPSRNCSVMKVCPVPLNASSTSLASYPPSLGVITFLMERAAAPSTFVQIPKFELCACASSLCSSSVYAARAALLPIAGFTFAQPAATIKEERLSPSTYTFPKDFPMLATVSSSSNVTCFPMHNLRTNSLAGQANGSSLAVPSRRPRRGLMIPARVI
mmetsp:Transcript_71887/g.150203  ORF Transcript_71887/g.150203 Transcript_71887/m.150203 type:complete len:217 (-) Transcript_71887:162-812(-)